MKLEKSRILHQFLFGQNSFDKFITTAQSLGYPMIEWNGIVFDVPKDLSQFSFHWNKVGVYAELFDEQSPVYRQ